MMREIHLHIDEFISQGTWAILKSKTFWHDFYELSNTNHVVSDFLQKLCWFHCVLYHWPNVTLNFIPCGLELNACSVQNGNTQLNSFLHDLHPPLLLYLREIMGVLTYIAFLIINGDEAYAGITGDVLPSPRDINLRASFIKEAQSVARGVAHRLQLLPLAFTNHCGRKSIGHQTCKYHLSF